MDNHFALLLGHVNDLIPIAQAARDQGKTIHRYLVKDHETVHQELNYGSLWKRWWVNTGWKGEKMRKDLEVAGQAIALIIPFLRDLEIARDNLIAYRAHIKQFKVRTPSRTLLMSKSNMNKQLPSHLSPEEQILNLSEIINKFERSVEEAKRPKSQRIHLVGQ
jgi:hypothetical protein